MTLEQLSNLSDAELDRLAAENVMCWRVRDGVYYQEMTRGIFPKCAIEDWQPAVDCNQSRDLLAAMVERGAEFETHWSKKQPRILYRTGKVTPERIWDGASPGVSARSETIAALLAAFAMEGKDSD